MLFVFYSKTLRNGYNTYLYLSSNRKTSLTVR